MNALIKITCWLTLWVDLCLVFGVLFTHQSADQSHSTSALMAIGTTKVSSLAGGSPFILSIAAWTAFLAIAALRANRRIETQRPEDNGG